MSERIDLDELDRICAISKTALFGSENAVGYPVVHAVDPREVGGLIDRIRELEGVVLDYYADLMGEQHNGAADVRAVLEKGTVRRG